MVSPVETTTEPSASLAILPVSIETSVDPIWAVTLCCITAAFWNLANPRPVTLIVGFNPAAAGLKPLIKVERRPECRVYFLFNDGVNGEKANERRELEPQIACGYFRKLSFSSRFLYRSDSDLLR